MSESPSTYFIGDQQVAVFIPSKFKGGGLIPDTDQDRILGRVQDELSRLFGGSTAPIRVDLVRGTFLHDDGSGRVTPERLRRVYAVAKGEALRDGALRAKVEGIAAFVARDLDQESVLMAWGAEYRCVAGSPDQVARHVPFKDFPEVIQRRFIRGACDQLRRAIDFRGVLSVDGWKVVADPETDPQQRVATKDGRRALLVNARSPLPALADGDLAFADDPDGAHIRVWAQVGPELRGPRRVPITDRYVARITVDVALSLLGSEEVSPLKDMLDRDLATSTFFRRYARLHDRLAVALGKVSGNPGTSPRDAQRLLGRLMFLRFLEKRGWLAGNRAYLAELFARREQASFTGALDSLFRELDTRETERSVVQEPGIPFLNGGLFHVSHPTPAIGDGFFDPARADSVLALFRDFDFTLDEGTSADEAVAVNPAMFGRVLESLCAPDRKKNSGVVYTPTPIAFALAFEAIASRLATLTRVPRDRIVSFLRGDRRAVEEKGAERLLKQARSLRIVDPAAGSGSLLLAALDVLMQVAAICESKRGMTLQRGGAEWGKHTRYFVQNCLFGVDIDAEAVEVARLRLWLAIAVADESPRALPDLTWNLCVGDSLSSRRFDRTILEKGLWKKQGDLFDRGASEFEAYVSALDAYQHAAPRGSSAVGAASERLVDAERELLRKLGTQGAAKPRASAPGAVPFAWAVHFGDVFAGKNQGFDVVIANPPYVRAANIEGDYEDYVSMKGNRDLYLAFVERALDLAGKEGQIAYVMPNFGDKTWAGGLRKLLAERGAVERMVSFGDQKVFSNALNFVALLFATSKTKRGSEFQGGRVPDESWRDAVDTRWLDEVAKLQVDGTAPIWTLRTPAEAAAVREISLDAVPLGELCQIGVGVQTSADDVFLFDGIRARNTEMWRVFSEHLQAEVELEPHAMRRCAKGSLDLQSTELLNDRWMLWPYGEDAQPLPEEGLKAKLPLAWAYLLRCRRRLESRNMTGASRAWWRFGRTQGAALGMRPKVIVPSLMKGAAAYLDASGAVVMTASGKGGGGAWGLTPKLRSDGAPAIDLARLAQYLATPPVWTWIEAEGDPKASGWRGVGQAVLKRLPVVLK